MPVMYQVKRAARSEFVPLRNQNYHVLAWGQPSTDTPPLMLVHGWMDVAASYQFMVDALSTDFMQDRFVIAPDWRGYGLSTGAVTDNYWFADYLADLDHLVDHYAQGRSIDLVGHSMGGSVVMHYGGIRPHRVRRLVNIEGFGGPASRPDQAPKRYAKWMDELKAYARGEMALRSYDSSAAVARRLSKTNPRLARDQAGRDKAQWLATQWARENDAGQWEILGHAAHKIGNAQLSRVDELLEIYKCLTMPVLAVEAGDSPLPGWWRGKFSLDEYHQRLQCVPDCRIAVIEDAGHMLHHDQPGQLAHMLEEFLR
jgi:pimeloyl-ACP methyl ester carboxylesterase